MRTAIFFAAIALPAGAPAWAGAIEPVQVAHQFVNAWSSDLNVASAMLTDDAMIGAGDIGGELDGELLKTLSDAFPKDCAFDFAHATAKPFDWPGRSIAVVTTPVNCDAGRASVEWEFMIEGEKIAGVILPGGGPLDEEYEDDSDG